MLSFEEFRSFVFKKVKECPDEWRKGQSVFNVIDSEFAVARTVQFTKHIDCFYLDNMIDEFINASYDVYKERINANSSI